ncbi:MAG: hypothetical protein ACOC7U_00890 [Spirochaetota bacterium]
MEKVEYAFDELSEESKDRAVICTGVIIKAKLGRGEDPAIDKYVVKCVIDKLTPTFDITGNLIGYSNIHEISREFLQEIIENCM